MLEVINYKIWRARKSARFFRKLEKNKKKEAHQGPTHSDTWGLKICTSKDVEKINELLSKQRGTCM